MLFLLLFYVNPVLFIQYLYKVLDHHDTQNFCTIFEPPLII